MANEPTNAPGQEGPSTGPNQAPGTTWHGSDASSAPWKMGATKNWDAPGADPNQSDDTAEKKDDAATNRAKKRRATLFISIGAVVLVAALAGLAPTYLSGRNTADNTKNPPAQSDQFHAQPGPIQQASGSAPDWTATAEAVAPSVVSITVNAYQGNAQGSGVILDKEGHVVTNHHVVADAVNGRGQIFITLNDKRTHKATVVGSDPSTDLATLKMVDVPSDVRPITLGDSDQLKVGVPVMAVGNPLGLSGTVTEGIISALDRPLITSGKPNYAEATISEDVITNAIQTSAAINPGNSGGALVNASGQLIGINSSIAQTQQGGGNIGIGFAIPVNAMKNIASQLIKNGHVQHAFVGISSQTGNVPEGEAQRAAALVAEVTPNSPAAEAGIRRGDAIVALNNDPIDGKEALVAQVRDHRAGEQVTLTIVRGKQRQDVQVTLGSRPQDTEDNG
ncbi:trypsin-like peptidase domain-containing protein [Dermatophilus congolensis]|uniref:Periplasmic serine endoprotease DegP n=1 Tax=Dermatophilus congolensis TaxID=1863 RepID=A0AA46GZM7_9MICO|nr:trypsin-like peptidase domain-containing protein [Dermatophilus congolensis]MBO3142097.1 trypsin-like serine protease [Dermatophilus congolensis]MBO3151089.1 trypsin-like serine protease [Dermatophilus congolensis]MBO3161908.1 trypsin-like serine protease [Dermatophilus congolensis]MBO3162372.1 trypsin-like serine protease [Dermatophilus congolensis]MBO3175930.1 trypsin-like serine protease [Dermatophilus congolensis]